MAVVGRANVGKSTLVNRLVGRKVAITAPSPQTTRTKLAAILTLPHAQLVFIDTPAFHEPRTRLGHRMVEAAKDALGEADVILFVVDAAAGITEGDETLARALRAVKAPVIVALNKSDRAGAGVVAVEAGVRALEPWAGVVPVSAAAGANLEELVNALVALLPEGPQYYPPEMVTDQPEDFLVRELIREQAVLLTREELPHGIAVEIEEFTARSHDLTYVRAVLHVERESHKKMLIGREGRLLKELGRRARHEIEALLGRRVYLDLWVKVSERWRDRDALIATFYPN